MLLEVVISGIPVLWTSYPVLARGHVIPTGVSATDVLVELGPRQLFSIEVGSFKALLAAAKDSAALRDTLFGDVAIQQFLRVTDPCGQDSFTRVS